MFPGRRLWMIGAALIGGIWAVGCQSSGGGGERDSRIPSFGVDQIPRQSEPDPSGDEARPVADSRNVGNASEGDDDDDEPAAPKGNLLTRLIPGREKGSLERKPLPLSKRSSESDDDDDEF